MIGYLLLCIKHSLLYGPSLMCIMISGKTCLVLLTGYDSVVNNILRSPRYPSDYPNSMYCVYRVSIPYDKEFVEQ